MNVAVIFLMRDHINLVQQRAIFVRRFYEDVNLSEENLLSTLHGYVQTKNHWKIIVDTNHAYQ